MIVQTAPTGTPRLAILMQEHTALCRQFAQAFGNDRFESLAPLDLMTYVISHHDAGWLLLWGKGRSVGALRKSLAVTEVAPALLSLYGIEPQAWQTLSAPAFILA